MSVNVSHAHHGGDFALFNDQAFRRVPSAIGTPWLCMTELYRLERFLLPCSRRTRMRRKTMGRYALLWLLGVPIPILLLIWAFGGLH
jgi:hypothetical protein